MTRVTAKLVSRTGNSLPNSGTEHGRHRRIRERRLCRPVAMNLSARSLGARDLVEEAEHGVDATVVVEDHDVEADNDRFGIGWAEAPSEAGLLVVCIDRTDRTDRARTRSRGTAPELRRSSPRLPCGRSPPRPDRCSSGAGSSAARSARDAPLGRSRSSRPGSGRPSRSSRFPFGWLFPPTMVIGPCAACRLPGR